MPAPPAPPVPPAPPPPEMFGYPTANIALLVSSVALVVAAVSAIYVWRTYRRAGARVKLRVQKTTARHGHGPGSQRAVVTKAGNKGLAPVELTHLYFEVKGRDPVVPRTFLKGKVPTTITGLHESDWLIALDELGLSGGEKIRAIAHFGGIRNAKSRRIKLLLAN